MLVDQRKDQAEHEHIDRYSRAVPQFKPYKTEAIHVRCESLACIDWSDFGHDPDQNELLDLTKHGHVHRSADRTSQQGQGDIKEILKTICTIDAGCFFKFKGYVLEASQIQQHVKAEVFPS